MPGPGSRAKASKSKKTAAKLASLPTFPTDAVGEADGWTPIVSILCSYFELPDLTTRKGLKKVLARFDAIYAKLNDAYEKNIANDPMEPTLAETHPVMW